MDLESIVIPLAVFAALVAIVWLIVDAIARVVVAHTLRDTAKANPDSVALIADRLNVRRSSVSAETIGLLGMALGAALAVAALIGGPADRVVLLQAALLPGFTGAALFGQRWIPRRPALPAAGE